MYKCKECNLEVIVLPDGEMIKGCAHTCGVVTDMEATCVGNGWLMF